MYYILVLKILCSLLVLFTWSSPNSFPGLFANIFLFHRVYKVSSAFTAMVVVDFTVIIVIYYLISQALDLRDALECVRPVERCTGVEFNLMIALLLKVQRVFS